MIHTVKIIIAPRLILEQATPFQNADVLSFPSILSSILNISGLISHRQLGSIVFFLAMIMINVTTFTKYAAKKITIQGITYPPCSFSMTVIISDWLVPVSRAFFMPVTR